MSLRHRHKNRGQWFLRDKACQKLVKIMDKMRAQTGAPRGMDAGRGHAWASFSIGQGTYGHTLEYWCDQILRGYFGYEYDTWIALGTVQIIAQDDWNIEIHCYTKPGDNLPRSGGA